VRFGITFGAKKLQEEEAKRNERNDNKWLMIKISLFHGLFDSTRNKQIANHSEALLVYVQNTQKKVKIFPVKTQFLGASFLVEIPLDELKNAGTILIWIRDGFAQEHS
jgi:hypothetical protein